MEADTFCPCPNAEERTRSTHSKLEHFEINFDRL